MHHEFPGRCPGLVYDAPSGLFIVPKEQTYDIQHLPADTVTIPKNTNRQTPQVRACPRRGMIPSMGVLCRC